MSSEQPEYAKPDWQQINTTVHRDGHFLFAISSGVWLNPGESEQLLSIIVREHNSHAALVDALRRSRDWMKEPMGGGLLHERFSDNNKDKCEPDCLRCAVNAALRDATKES